MVDLCAAATFRHLRGKNIEVPVTVDISHRQGVAMDHLAIEQLAAEQITGGCGGGNYCPASPSTRGQMAVFLTKTLNLQ